MKVGKHRHEEEIENMPDEHLQHEYDELIQDQVVANAVKAVLLKFEIERRRDEVLKKETKESRKIANKQFEKIYNSRSVG